jgi:hypothetical protein
VQTIRARCSHQLGGALQVVTIERNLEQHGEPNSWRAISASGDVVMAGAIGDGPLRSGADPWNAFPITLRANGA